MKIGFIGLGNMGMPMAKNLSQHGHEVVGYDIIERNSKRFVISDQILDAVSNKDVIITMLPDGSSVLDVYSKILKNLKTDTILVDCSTIDVVNAKKVANFALESGFKALDAPVSGGIGGAENGTLTFMVGGDQSIYKDVINLFEIMGNKAILCGSFGAGQTAKICNNLLLASTMIALGESLNLGKNLGLEMEKLFEVLSTSSGSCWAVNNYFPLKNIGPTSPADNNYSGGFSTALMTKDLNLAVEAGKISNTELKYGNQTYNKFKDLMNKNLGNLDFSNVVNN